MRRLTKASYYLLLILLPFSLSPATDILSPNRPLADGETLVSANGTFALGFFTPSPTSRNRYVGIWYNKVSVLTVVWVANRNNPIPGTAASLSINVNGTLVITDHNITVIWAATPSSAVSNPIAQILDTGNFVVRDADGSSTGFYAWQSFDYPTDTLLPGMKLGWNLTSGLSRNLTAWASPTDPSTGPCTMALDLAGGPQISLWSGPMRMWRSGARNGVQFSGKPEMESYSFVQNADEVYYQFYMKDPTVISRLIVSYTCSTQRLVWLDQRLSWDLLWSSPKDQCDSVSPCGPFGVCTPDDSPQCACVQGFVPRNLASWDLLDLSEGCIRKTQLDCRNETDGFLNVSEAKLPDTSKSTVDMDMSLEQCRAMCLLKCSCTAYASADINGTGCLIWTTDLIDLSVRSFSGQDLYVRLAAADLALASGHSHKKNMIVAIVVSFISVIFLLTCVCCFLWKKKKRTGCFQWKRKKRMGDSSLFCDQSSKETEKNDLDLPSFGFGTIAAAIDYFAAENKLGEGGFGPVYKGKLGESQEIAVKRLAKTSQQGTDEFKNEVMLIAKLQHRNLVRLLGYCIQGEERMLIYEYMPNKSLDAFLFDKEKGALLDWKTRYQIIIGITRGLLYLHHDSRFRIIHRDLKASNILLDKEMTPKISDFGMARIFGGDETDFNTRKVVGTYGYMSPEYAMAGIFSMKSDVFSFGVLVLEIISGRKNRGAYSFPPHLNLVAHVWSLWNEGKSLQIVHESMNDSFPPEEVLKCVKVGLLCVQERPEDRPLMSSVVVMLGSASDIAPLPQPNQPGFIASTGFPEMHPPTPSKKQESCTLNDITVSLHGR